MIEEDPADYFGRRSNDTSTTLFFVRNGIDVSHATIIGWKILEEI